MCQYLLLLNPPRRTLTPALLTGVFVGLRS
jgi:hypothetical protein